MTFVSFAENKLLNCNLYCWQKNTCPSFTIRTLRVALYVAVQVTAPVGSVNDGS